MQAKLNKVDFDTPLEHWGELYTGADAPELSVHEYIMRALILSGGMPVTGL